MLELTLDPAFAGDFVDGFIDRPSRGVLALTIHKIEKEKSVTRIKLNDPQVQAAIIQAATTIVTKVYKSEAVHADKIALHVVEMMRELEKVNEKAAELSEASIG